MVFVRWYSPRPMQGRFPYSVLPFQATSYFRIACWSHGILSYWLFYHVILPYCLPCPWHTLVLQARSTSSPHSSTSIQGILSYSVWRRKGHVVQPHGRPQCLNNLSPTASGYWRLEKIPVVGDWKIDNWSPKMLKASRQTSLKGSLPSPAQKRWKQSPNNWKETYSPGSSPVRSIADGLAMRPHLSCAWLVVSAISWHKSSRRDDRLRRRLCVRTSSSCAVAELLKTLRRIHAVDDVKFTAQKKKER